MTRRISRIYDFAHLRSARLPDDALHLDALQDVGKVQPSYWRQEEHRVLCSLSPLKSTNAGYAETENEPEVEYGLQSYVFEALVLSRVYLVPAYY